MSFANNARMMKVLSSVYLQVFHLVLLLPFSSENNSCQANGTRGAPWLWRCHHTFSKPFQPEKSFIYWQGQDNSGLVVYMYNKGKPDLKHQSQSFKNRTKIFPDQLHDGNLSLVIEELILKDDQTSLEVIFNSPSESTKKLCQTTVCVAAPFQEPKLEINQSNKTATCSTKGGYPKPEIKWTSQGGQNQSERTLEQHEVKTTMTSEEDGTYSTSSTANITGSQRVTCRVHNPTSNQTLSVTKDTTLETPDKRHDLGIGIGFVVALVCVVALIVILYLHRRRTSNWSPQPTANPSGSSASGGSAGGNAGEAPSNMQNRNVESADESEPETVNLLPGHQSALYCLPVRRDGATASATNEDSSASEETNDRKKDADETKTTESDKDK
ncbi:CD276 antigen homolog [Thunnus thynnus]|uniref:CD276 antigen homolog n=1 Tax=Thunnus thynnus TaxID=8237 RepID=UPI0035274DA9